MALQTGSRTENTTSGVQNNRTGTALSTHIVIMVGLHPVGAVQSIEISEKRNVTPIDEVGTDGHIDSAPTKSTDISGSCRRIRYDKLRIAEAFGRGFLHAKSQRIPFNIDIYDYWNGNPDNAIVTTIKNVWITGIDYSYAADNWIITENMTWQAEDIISRIGGSTSAATGGVRGLTLLETDSEGIEREADLGIRRGAVDSNLTLKGKNSGIINSIIGSL